MPYCPETVESAGVMFHNSVLAAATIECILVYDIYFFKKFIGNGYGGTSKETFPIFAMFFFEFFLVA